MSNLSTTFIVFSLLGSIVIVCRYYFHVSLFLTIYTPMLLVHCSLGWLVVTVGTARTGLWDCCVYCVSCHSAISAIVVVRCAE